MGQATFPENGVVDPRHGTYAFTNATIVKDVATTLNNATMVIKDGKIISVGTSVKVPAGAVEVDCKGKFIYPSFIDIYADYGTTLPTPQQGQGGGAVVAFLEYNNLLRMLKVLMDGTRL
jgi:imidazolonepropionase-like amidohydrolase